MGDNEDYADLDVGGNDDEDFEYDEPEDDGEY